MGATPAPTDLTQEALATLGGAAGMTRTQTGYTTAIAVQVARDLPVLEKAILYEAAQMGEDFIYSWRVKDKKSKEADGKSEISGMSIEGAMIMLRNWGNCACPVKLVDESADYWLFEATFVDLERGFEGARLFRQRKRGIAGEYDAERALDMVFQIGQSKAIRNAIVQSMPAWLRNRAIEASRNAAAGKYKDVAVHIPAVVKYAAGLGVSEPQLVERIGKPLLAWTPYDIVYIRSVFKTIADKQSSVLEEFPPIEASPPAADPPVVSADEARTVTVTVDGEVIGARPGSTPPPTPAHAVTVTLDGGPASPAEAPPSAPQKTAEQLEAEEAERALSAQEARDREAAK